MQTFVRSYMLFRMSLRHLLGPETKSSFIIDTYSMHWNLDWGYIFWIIQIDLIKRTTFIVYGHQENFIKGLEENSYKNISSDNTLKKLYL